MKKLIKRFRFMFKIQRFIPFLVEFFLSQEVSLSKKIISILLVGAYIMLPIDAIPDFLGIFGLVDDVTIFMLILQQIIKMAPTHLKNKYGI